MAAPNVPPRRVSMSYLLGFSKTPFKEPKPPRAYPGPRPGGLGDMVSTPGGIVEWAASDGRRGKLNGSGKTRAFSEGEAKAAAETGAQAANRKQAEKKEEAKANGNNDAVDKNEHGFTPEEDAKLTEWRTANEGKPWQPFAEKIGRTKEQCRERWGQIRPKDGDQNAGAQQGGKGGSGGGQQNQQSQKLSKKEKKALKQGGGSGQNHNQGQGNNQTNDQTSGGDAKPSNNNNADQGNGDDPWGPGFAMFEEQSGGNDKNGGANNDANNPWAPEQNSGNAGETPGWTADSGSGGWPAAGNNMGGNNSWDNMNSGASTKSGGKKKDKKEKSNGSKTGENGWAEQNDSSGGGNGDWGGDAFNNSGGSVKGVTDTWGGFNNGSGSNQGGGSKSGDGSRKDGSQLGGWGGGWGGSQQKSPSTKGGDGKKPGSQAGWDQKPASNNGGKPADTWGTTGVDGAQDNNAQAWNTEVPQDGPPMNGGDNFGTSWDTTAPAAKPASKAPSHHRSHKSAHHHSSHGHQSSKDRTAAPLELEVKPDSTFSADDLRLVARILQQDYQMVWQRVSWRFKDKTGRNVPPEVFEKKITGRVEGEERERSERRKRR